MAKYSEIVALLEYMKVNSPQKPSKPKVRGPFKTKMKDFDFPAYVRQRKDELEHIEKFMKDFNKKDDKKEEAKRKTFIGVEWYILGLASYPLMMYLSNNFPAVLK